MKIRFGIRSKLLISFFTFSAIVVAILWVLEVLLLDDVYRQIKIRSVRTAADQIQKFSDDAISNFVVEQATTGGICAAIYDENLNLIAGEHAGGKCIVHNIHKNTVSLFYQTTQNCAGQRFESYLPAEEITKVLKKNQDSLWFYDHFFGSGRDDDFPLKTEEAYDCVLISKTFQNIDGQNRYALLSTVIIPVDSTVLTIRFELLVISVALVIVSLVIAYFLSRAISKPIESLNSASKRLPDGQFSKQGIFGYREVEELSETLSLAAQEISQVDKLRQELLANVSHDLRTPLTLISGYSEAMRDLPGENTPENLQIVIDETHRLSELVSDLLDLSKLEAGMDQLQLEEIELVSFIQEICKRYEKMTGFYGYDLEMQSSVKTAYVFADRIKLNQVVYNLINNAINYCKQNKRILVRISATEDQALVEIFDHGPGIPPEKLEHIWDRYYRASENHSSAKVGTGLGLSIVKKVLVLHKADFGVESKLGEGSRFWFAIPLFKN